MRSKIILGVFLLVVAAFPALAQETVDVVKVHGIVEISEEEIISIAGVKPGDVLTSDLLDKIRSNLLSTGKFSSVEVLKRYRSLTDSSKVSVIILVEEKQSFFNRFMYLPVVGFTDGKLLYGGVVGSTDLLGFGEHISAPVIMEGSDINTIGLTTFFDSENLLFNRITFSAMKTSTENMHFEIDDERIFVNANIAKRVGPLFISLNGGYEEVKFAELEDKYYTVGGLAVFDTRRDVLLPSDAVYAGFNWQRYDEKDGEKKYDIQTFDFRGFKSLIGRSMIGGQFLYQKSNAALPDYFRPYGGGASRLRGHEEGKYLGDKFFLATTEIRIPFSAHDSEAIYGIHSFYNVGKIAFHGEDLSDATLRKGAGFGAFFFMHGSGFRLDIGNDLEGNYAVHFGSDFTF